MTTPLCHPTTPCGIQLHPRGGDPCTEGNYCETCQYVEDVKVEVGRLEADIRRRKEKAASRRKARARNRVRGRARKRVASAEQEEQSDG